MQPGLEFVEEFGKLAVNAFLRFIVTSQGAGVCC
jgi:hypothetical protein